MLQAMLSSRSSKDERAMHLLRSMFQFLATYDVTIVGEHISGIKNRPADSLSRDNHRFFLLQVPRAWKEPSSSSRGAAAGVGAQPARLNLV